MIRSLALVTLTLVAIAHAGCGGTPPGTGGELTVGEVDVEYADIGGGHIYMTTGCPQPVGTILITNPAGGDVDVTVQVRSSASQLYFENGGPTVLAPGESVEVSVYFNCSSTADIATDLVIGVTPADSGTETTGTIPFTLDVQGA